MTVGSSCVQSSSSGAELNTCVALDIGCQAPLAEQMQTPRGAEFALTLFSGASVSPPPFRARGPVRLRLRGVLSPSDAEAAAVGPSGHVEFRLCNASAEQFASYSWHLSSTGSTWIDLEQELHHAAYGEFRLHVLFNGPAGGGLRIVELVVGDLSLAAQAHALANYSTRLRREIGNFNADTYSSPLYRDKRPASEVTGSDQEIALQPASRLPHATDFRAQSRGKIRSVFGTLRGPADDETAFAYAEYLLANSLPIAAPNFLARIRTACRVAQEHGRVLRVLSICSGAARVETQLLNCCEYPIELTLQDANSELIHLAAKRLGAGGHRVSYLLGDINDGLPGDESFDIILCVSGLHHVVNVERVLREANARLLDQGEFWSIGEQIGRNGNRLWPEARDAADRIFSVLPARLRKNAHTGQTDDRIDDHDYSIGSFEGIRSEELESLLSAFFIPVDEYKRNCFLWRAVNAAYSANYDLKNHEDVRWLKLLVESEVLHWVDGGRATELHGIYRKKCIADS